MQSGTCRTKRLAVIYMMRLLAAAALGTMDECIGWQCIDKSDGDVAATHARLHSYNDSIKWIGQRAECRIILLTV